MAQEEEVVISQRRKK